MHRTSPVHLLHGKVALRLASAIERALEAAGLDLIAAVETSIDFGDGFTPTADIVVCEGDHAGFVPGAAVRLIVEVALSSLADDLGDKAVDYARGGLREYLVADVVARVVHHHWAPSADGYGERAVVRFGEPLTLRSFARAVIDTTRLG